MGKTCGLFSAEWFIISKRSQFWFFNEKWLLGGYSDLRPLTTGRCSERESREVKKRHITWTETWTYGRTDKKETCEFIYDCCSIFWKNCAFPSWNLTTASVFMTSPATLVGSAFYISTRKAFSSSEPYNRVESQSILLVCFHQNCEKEWANQTERCLQRVAQWRCRFTGLSLKQELKMKIAAHN